MPNWRLAVAGVLVVAAVATAADTVGAVLSAATLTIAAVPNPILSGEPVLIYGQSKGAHGGTKIVLHGRIDPASAFTVLQAGATDATGFYEFSSAESAVSSDESWFVTSPGGRRSRTVHELVASVLTLAASAATGETGAALTFTGLVAPGGIHVGQTVFLQKHVGDAGNDWKTIGQGAIDAGSGFSISHSFLLPGAFDLRALLDLDTHNTMGASDPLTVVIQQTQKPDFTINSSTPAVDAGQSVTISGELYTAGSTSSPIAGKSLTLWGHDYSGSYAPITSTTTGADGSYSFAQTPTRNVTYEVRTTFTPPPRRQSAELFEAVRDVVTLTPSSTSATVGSALSFTGTVTPDKAGHVIDLERMERDGSFHIVATSNVNASSAYSLTATFGSAGAETLHAQIPGGNANAGGISPPVVIGVTLPSVTSLPAAS